MKRATVDWSKVEALLDAHGREQIGCPFCIDQGTVPYIAEHVLVTHSGSSLARRLARAVVSHSRPRSA